MTWHLSQQGWRVSLIEEEPTISRKASGNLAGVISPKMTARKSAGEQFYRDAFNYTTAQIDTLAKTTSSNLSNDSAVHWTPCGMLQLAHNSRELQRWKTLRQRELNSDFIQFPGQDKTSQIAGLTCDYPASYFPQAGFINPASFCKSLLSSSNYQLIHSTKVTRLHHAGGFTEWEVLDNDGVLIQRAPLVILATGTDLNRFTQSNFLPQIGVLGQTSHVDSTWDNKINCVIGHEGYLTPAYQGVNVFGATFDREYETVTTSAQADQRNLLQLNQYLPSFASKLGTLTSGHAAIRATTPDRYPYAGAVPNAGFYTEHYQDLKHGRPHQAYPSAKYQNGLFVLGGFGSRGLTTSGYCANVLSQLINNRISPEQSALLDTLHPARFLIRQLKRGMS